MLFRLQIDGNLWEFYIRTGIIFDIFAGLHCIIQGAGEAGEDIFQHVLGISIIFLPIDPTLDGIRLQGCEAVLSQRGLNMDADLALIVHLRVITELPDIVVIPIVQIVGHADL